MSVARKKVTVTFSDRGSFDVNACGKSDCHFFAGVVQ